MAGLGFLTSALGSTGSLNWTWTIELIVCIILVLFFLFYFNRLFAAIISYSLRAYTWHKLHVWIDIQALQLSFLAGRIFFKGVRYHGENETIFIQQGFVTWRYWQDSARQVDLSWDEQPAEDADSTRDDTASTDSPNTATSEKPRQKKGSNQIPIRPIDTSKARIGIHVTGLEWYVYNRGPVYDAILRQVFREPTPQGSSTESDGNNGVFEKVDQISSKDEDPSHASHRGSVGPRSSIRDVQMTQTGTALIQMRYPNIMRQPSKATSEGDDDKELSHISIFYTLMIKALPIAVECVKGAILLGNENTRALVVTTFAKATGHLDAAASGPLDIFRQAFEFEVEHPVARMRPNPDYRRPQFSAAERILRALDSPKLLRKWWQFSFGIQERRQKAHRTLQNLVPAFRSSVLSFHGTRKEKANTPNYSDLRYNPDDENEWHGLTRYLDDNEADEHEAWFSIEYARYSTLVDVPAVRLNFFWDNAGPVRKDHASKAHADLQRDINGTTPPAYGLDLTVRGGTVNYGPWADRLRQEIQTAFLPNGYTSVTPSEPLEAGDMRQSSVMVIRIDIPEELTLRIPTKENSKDWQWRGRASAVRDAAALRRQREKKHFRFRSRHKTAVGLDVRPFGWMSIKVGSGSNVRYDMDMVARQDGYHNYLTLELKDVEATTSVNHAALWHCPLHKVTADLSNSLQWNGLHTWTFTIECDSLEMFMLRDHMFLLTDLISDFTAGVKSDYMTFVPFKYCMDVVLNDFKLYLNANDYNIIDNPTDLKENTFLILGFENLDGVVEIPLDQFVPELSSVIFSARGQNARFDLKSPVWSTLHTFMESETMATLKGLQLEGNYNYNPTTADNLTDCLFMDIVGTGTRAYLQGYLIRYFMNVQENYFGEHLHFRTFEEYQDLLGGEGQKQLSTSRPGGKKDNDLDVVLSIRADDSHALMPANIYSRKENVRFDILLVEADMRFTNYYMDLQVTSSPIEAALENTVTDEDGTRTEVTNCQLFIDGINVYGHRLFGAPPTEPTYVCNWDFEVGDISGEFSSIFLRTLINSIQALTFTLDDFENALPELATVAIHDITFLRAKLNGVKLCLVSEQAAVLVEVAGSDVSFNDWAGARFAKLLSANVPDVKVAVVDVQNGQPREGRHKRDIPTWAFLQLSARVSTLDKSKDLVEFRQLQQQHVHYHDLRTHRADVLLHPSERPHSSGRRPEWSIPPPAMPLPLMPVPLQGYTVVGEAKPRHGFIIPSLMTNSEASSISSGEDASANKLFAAQPPKISRPVSEVPDHHSKSQDQMPKPSFVTFSSRWSAPHFPMLHVEPDTKYVPQLPKDLDKPTPTKPAEEEIEGIEWEQAQNSPHLGILLELERGLVGFCTPELAGAVAGITKELTYKEPTDQLDSMQYEAVATVMKSFDEHKPRSMLDLEIRLPLVNIRVVHEQKDRSTPEYFPVPPDFYNLKISNTRLSFRLRPRVVHGEIVAATDDVLTFLSMEQLAITLKDGTLENPKVPSRAEIMLSQLSAWWSAIGKTRAKVQFSDLDISILGTESDRFTDYIHRNLMMIDVVKSAFVKDDHEEHSKRLIYHLAQLGPRTTDPIFLTKPSYVLRSAEQHLRSSDSWKIISRLRYIYQSLEMRNETELVRTCTCRHQHLDNEARKEVQSSFEQWRGWNPDGEEHVDVMNSIYAPPAPTVKAPLDINMEADLVVDRILIAVQHGHRQSSLTLTGLDLGFMAASVSRGHDENHKAQPKQQKIVLHSYLADFNLTVHWDILDVVRYVLENKPAIDALSKKATVQTQDAVPALPSSQPVDVYVVFGSDRTTIYVQSMNLLLSLGTESLRSSCILSTNGKMLTAAMISLASGLAEAKLEHQSQTLMGCQLSSPKLYTSWLPRNGEKIKNSRLQLCAAGERIRFDLKKDLPGMLEIVESVIGDEVTDISNLMELVPPAPKKSNKAAAPHLPPPDILFNIALFLNDYEITLALLPTIRYRIRGSVARTSVASQLDGVISLNFDLKQHTHKLNHSTEKTAQEHSLALQIPPINGWVSVKDADSMMLVKAHTAIELVTVEATVLRAWFDALNHSEVIRSFKGLGKKVEEIRRLVNRVFPSESPAIEETMPAEPETPTLIQYIVHATFGGFNVHCRAPSIREENYQADLDVGLRAISIRMHNRSDNQANPVTKWPQFEINIRQLGFGIRRSWLNHSSNFGHFTMGIKLTGTTEVDKTGEQLQVYKASSSGLNVDLYEETASLVVDITAFLRQRLSSMTLSEEAKNIKPLRRLTISNVAEDQAVNQTDQADETDLAEWMLFNSVYALNLDQILVRWRPGAQSHPPGGRELEDVAFSIRNIDLQTKREGSARLSILDLQLQLVPQSQHPLKRTGNSALLPEIVFSAAYQSTTVDRRFAFQAKGKALDLRISSDFVVPAKSLQKSLVNANEELQKAKAGWTFAASPLASPQKSSAPFLSGKRLASLLVDADFAGAVVNMLPRQGETEHAPSAFSALKGQRKTRTSGRYGQAMQGDNAAHATLKSPGMALKIGFSDDGEHDPVLNAEMKIAASSNTLYPSVVPLILDISSSIKETIGDTPAPETPEDSKVANSRYLSDSALKNTDPSTLLGRCKLNAGLMIEQQEFSLSCQPIARVAATTRFQDISVIVNTVQSQDHGRFFSILIKFNKLGASVQHVYSRESTANFDVESIVISLMNSRHVSASTGISAILNISPVTTNINAKQLQDFMLFREIWYPAEIRGTPAAADPASSADTSLNAMKRYQQMSTEGALPWHAAVSVELLQLSVDFGQGLGQADFKVSKLWASSKKSSDSEQNLCIGVERVGIDCAGRTSGFVELANIRVRTSIYWRHLKANSVQAPLIQASVQFDHLRLKTSFDYQPFAVADVSFFEFIMYNVSDGPDGSRDRLVALLDGGKVQAFCTTGTAAQTLSVYQAFERLIQETHEAYQESLSELDRYLRRKSVFPAAQLPPAPDAKPDSAKTSSRGQNVLSTDVVVSLQALDAGVFPNTFYDTQVLKAEAIDVQARFTVNTAEHNTHSGLGMRLGEVRVALSSVSKTTTKALGDVSVVDVIERATTSKGGTIVRVPELVASMQTWQEEDSHLIEYIFRSIFKGKVDVGWNYSRISFIRGMWTTHSKALAQRLGKPLPQSAVKITAHQPGEGTGGQEKITAVVNMPQSKYHYVPLEPPIIDTPQLRDMGEATPPLEWIGLHRDKLPEATHSVAIVSLLEIAKEVEDAYMRILGSA